MINLIHFCLHSPSFWHRHMGTYVSPLPKNGSLWIALVVCRVCLIQWTLLDVWMGADPTDGKDRRHSWRRWMTYQADVTQLFWFNVSTTCKQQTLNHIHRTVGTVRNIHQNEKKKHKHETAADVVYWSVINVDDVVYWSMITVDDDVYWSVISAADLSHLQLRCVEFCTDFTETFSPPHFKLIH